MKHMNQHKTHMQYGLASACLLKEENATEYWHWKCVHWIRCMTHDSKCIIVHWSNSHTWSLQQWRQAFWNFVILTENVYMWVAGAILRWQYVYCGLLDNGFSYLEDEECKELQYESNEGDGFSDEDNYFSSGSDDIECCKSQIVDYSQLELIKLEVTKTTVGKLLQVVQM